MTTAAYLSWLQENPHEAQGYQLVTFFVTKTTCWACRRPMPVSFCETIDLEKKQGTIAWAWENHMKIHGYELKQLEEMVSNAFTLRV